MSWWNALVMTAGSVVGGGMLPSYTVFALFRELVLLDCFDCWFELAPAVAPSITFLPLRFCLFASLVARWVLMLIPLVVPSVEAMDSLAEAEVDTDEVL